MQITKDTVVSFHYRLLDDRGEQLESSEGGEPTMYLHGYGGMLPGLEQELADKSPGDSLTVFLEQPYGPRHDDTVQRIPLKHFLGSEAPAPGKVVVVKARHGTRQVTILKVGKYSVDVDTNHPLAGFDLSYDITVVGVRKGTPEELEQAQVLVSDDLAAEVAVE